MCLDLGLGVLGFKVQSSGFRIMEKKMETSIKGKTLGLCGDNGKENGNYIVYRGLGFRG